MLASAADELVSLPMTHSTVSKPALDGSQTVVDLVFPAYSVACSQTLAKDHGCALFNSICRLVPSAYGARWLGVHPLRSQARAGMRLLHPRACLVLRLPASRIPAMLSLSDQVLPFGNAGLRIGIPIVRQLRPIAALKSRLVVIRLTNVPHNLDGTINKPVLVESYKSELRRQLGDLPAEAIITLGAWRRITVDGRRVLGVEVRLSELTEQDSLRVQAMGLGSKRAMGCGVFVPARKVSRRGLA